MGYFTQIMIEAKERYGHILKERNLVMRGERADGGLTLAFRTRDPNGWNLPVELYVPGKSETRKDRAEWEDVQLTADIHSEVKFGDTGWVGYIPRQSEQLEYLEGDDMAGFVNRIGLYLKEVVLVPMHESDKEVSPEVAAAYDMFSDLCGTEGPEIAFTIGGEVQTVTVEDAAGREVSFVWRDSGSTGEILVDGKRVRRLQQPEPRQIEQAISSRFREWTGPQTRQCL
ncbi:hypothetical protein [Rhizobium phaseoli]|uniref:hypothetical protein n=1 Tax=Rhizobium phaseoli TaxID=396 RepID=UPI000E0D8FD2|nr:hypothetical protein [Rhizobium phaseoli]